MHRQPTSRRARRSQQVQNMQRFILILVSWISRWTWTIYTFFQKCFMLSATCSFPIFSYPFLREDSKFSVCLVCWLIWYAVRRPRAPWLRIQKQLCRSVKEKATHRCYKEFEPSESIGNVFFHFLKWSSFMMISDEQIAQKRNWYGTLSETLQAGAFGAPWIVLNINGVPQVSFACVYIFCYSIQRWENLFEDFFFQFFQMLRISFFFSWFGLVQFFLLCFPVCVEIRTDS